jgi:SAM-dependent methyltransferase
VKSRSQIQKEIVPILDLCDQFVEGRPKPTHPSTKAPDLKRVSMIICMALELHDNASGQGLEIGSGYGKLLFPMATSMPQIAWTALEIPGRQFLTQPEYRATLHKFNCQLVLSDIVHNGLPFADWTFDLVTFSEVLEHLPIEHLSFVLTEIARVTKPGGTLIVSSPNQVSLENRILLLRGRSILEMPAEYDYASGTFGHIRLYTTAEIKGVIVRLGFDLARCEIESCNAGYRGTSERSLRRRAHRAYERIEHLLFPLTAALGDTWYLAFSKRSESSSPSRSKAQRS